MPGGARAGAGRKPIKIDLLELEKLCAMDCTFEELAAWFGVSGRTIENRRKQPRFAEVMRRGRAVGSTSVRRQQVKLLEAVNPAIAIFLGKTRLGQQESLQITGADGGPIQTEGKLDFSRPSVDELRALNVALAKASVAQYDPKSGVHFRIDEAVRMPHD